MTADNETLGRCIDNGWTIYANCETWGCQHGKMLNLEALAKRLGRDHGALHKDLVGLRWKCERCSGAKVSFRYQPGGSQYGREAGADPDEAF